MPGSSTFAQAAPTATLAAREAVEHLARHGGRGGIRAGRAADDEVQIVEDQIFLVERLPAGVGREADRVFAFLRPVAHLDPGPPEDVFGGHAFFAEVINHHHRADVGVHAGVGQEAELDPRLERQRRVVDRVLDVQVTQGDVGARLRRPGSVLVQRGAQHLQRGTGRQIELHRLRRWHGQLVQTVLAGGQVGQG